MSNDTDERVTVRGSNNVFADLGYADAETHLLKAGLVSRIQEIVRIRKLTQKVAATRMGISQPDLSRLLRGQFRDVSVERLMRMLNKLGCDVDIVVHEAGKKAKASDAIYLQAVPI